MLTVADRREWGVNFAKILLTSYVNAPLQSGHNWLQFNSLASSGCNLFGTSSITSCRLNSQKCAMVLKMTKMNKN